MKKSTRVNCFAISSSGKINRRLAGDKGIFSSIVKLIISFFVFCLSSCFYQKSDFKKINKQWITFAIEEEIATANFERLDSLLSSSRKLLNSERKFPSKSRKLVSTHCFNKLAQRSWITSRFGPNSSGTL